MRMNSSAPTLIPHVTYAHGLHYAVLHAILPAKNPKASTPQESQSLQCIPDAVNDTESTRLKGAQSPPSAGSISELRAKSEILGESIN